MDVGRAIELARRGGANDELGGVRVLVTGADGFIGSHLAERLVGRGRGARVLLLQLQRLAGLAGRGVGVARSWTSVSATCATRVCRRACDGATWCSTSPR